MIRLRGPIERADVEAVCRRACQTIGVNPRATSEPVVCDLDDIRRPALPAVDVLARLAVAARRAHRELRLEHGSPALAELLDLCGLADLLRGGADSGGSGKVSR